MSVLPSTTDIVRPPRHVRFVPVTDIADEDTSESPNWLIAERLAWASTARCRQLLSQLACRKHAKKPQMIGPWDNALTSQDGAKLQSIDPLVFVVSSSRTNRSESVVDHLLSFAA
jgi:hypothetical protein